MVKEVLHLGGVEILHSFHATRTAHVAHSGVRQVNYSRWRHPDCHHVCSPSGPEELRSVLLFNMLLSRPGDRKLLLPKNDSNKNDSNITGGESTAPMASRGNGSSSLEACASARTINSRRACIARVTKESRV